MAKSAKWEEQCRTEFLFAADHLIHKNKGKGVTKVLHQLAKESGLAYGTLNRWFYTREQSYPKNEVTEPPTQRSELCRVCGINPARRHTTKDGKTKFHHALRFRPYEPSSLMEA